MDIVFSGLSILLSFLLTYIALPFLKTHLGKREVAFARDIITDIVASLEGETLTGPQKKELAIKIAKQVLKLKKIKLPDMFINALIESSLYFLRKGFKEPIPKKDEKAILTYSVKSKVLN